jgi:cytochrome c oxidase cbb3-type subunit 3
MDARWIYGSAPDNIYSTIVEGRPNGMPAFRGKVPQQQVWQLVAYVRSLSGLAPSDAAPSRGDEMRTRRPESLTTPESPVREPVVHQ